MKKKNEKVTMSKGLVSTSLKNNIPNLISLYAYLFLSVGPWLIIWHRDRVRRGADQRHEVWAQGDHPDFLRFRRLLCVGELQPLSNG